MLLGVTQCGKTTNRQLAESINRATALQLKEADVEIIETRKSGNALLAEVKVKTALKFVREEGRWELDEIRLADRRWEKASHILAVLDRERTQTTLHTLREIDGAILLYRNEEGRVPQVADFNHLMDALTPRFLDRIIRLDSWSNPLVYRAHTATAYSLSSMGPDGTDGSGDDIRYEEAP